MATSALVAALAACGSKKSNDATGGEPTAGARLDDYAECRDYFQSLEGCMRKLSPESPDIAVARSANARQAVEALSVDRAREACSAGAAQLHSSCL